MNQKENKNKYRPPTEAEWEYACRAGTKTIRFWGHDPDQACEYANLADLTEWSGFTWNPEHKCRDGFWFSAPVGSFKANPWGLFDILGNVWEWCEDWYGDYPSGSVTDPTGPSSGASRVLRGGSWFYVPWAVGCANRGGDTPDGRYSSLGFRLLRTE